MACVGRLDIHSLFIYLLSPFQQTLPAIWVCAAEHWPHKQQKEAKNSGYRNWHSVLFIKADLYLDMDIKGWFCCCFGGVCVSLLKFVCSSDTALYSDLFGLFNDHLPDVTGNRLLFLD